MNAQIPQLTPAQAAQFLAGRGYDVANLDGGMTQWIATNRPTV